MKKWMTGALALAMVLAMALTGCGGGAASGTASAGAAASGSAAQSDNVLTVAMECAYAPYNWTQSDDSNGAVPIKGSEDYQRLRCNDGQEDGRGPWHGIGDCPV